MILFADRESPDQTAQICRLIWALSSLPAYTQRQGQNKAWINVAQPHEKMTKKCNAMVHITFQRKNTEKSVCQ